MQVSLNHVCELPVHRNLTPLSAVDLHSTPRSAGAMFRLSRSTLLCCGFTSLGIQARGATVTRMHGSEDDDLEQPHRPGPKRSFFLALGHDNLRLAPAVCVPHRAVLVLRVHLQCSCHAIAIG